MTTKEVLDTVSESHLWNTLTIAEKKDALAHAVEMIFGAAAVAQAAGDIDDAAGEACSR